MWLDRIRKFFVRETAEEKAKRLQDLAYAAGVANVDQYRAAHRVEGASQFYIPEHRVQQLWREFDGERNQSFRAGMEKRLNELGHVHPCIKSLDIAHGQISAMKPYSKAERTRLFYRLAVRADCMTMEEFIRDFKYVFRTSAGDTKDYGATMRMMHYDTAWISGQKKDFNQYNPFANKTKTLDVFFAKNRARIS